MGAKENLQIGSDVEYMLKGIMWPPTSFELRPEMGENSITVKVCILCLHCRLNGMPKNKDRLLRLYLKLENEHSQLLNFSKYSWIQKIPLLAQPLLYVQSLVHPWPNFSQYIKCRLKTNQGEKLKQIGMEL